MKKNILKIGTALTATILPISAIISCGQQKYDVGATVWKASDPFMSVVKRGFEKGAEITNQTFSWVDGEGNQTKLKDKVSALVNSGVKALAVNLVDPAAAQTIVNIAKAKDIPIVLYNKEASKTVMSSYNKVWYVGTRSRESGEMQIETIAKSIKDGILKDRNGDGKLQYFIINGEGNHPDAQARTEAVREDLPKELEKEVYQTDFNTLTTADYNFYDKDGNITTTTNDYKWGVNKTTKKVVIIKGSKAEDLKNIYEDIDYITGDPKNSEYNTTDWGSSDGKNIATAKIAKAANDNNKLDFISANNDGTALGAIAALKEKSFVKLDTKEKAAEYSTNSDINYMPVFGVDYTKDAKQSIEEGYLTGTVINDGINQGAISMIMAVNSYKKGITNSQILSGIDPAIYKFKNELTTNSKAIRVAYKGVYRDSFEKYQ